MAPYTTVTTTLTAQEVPNIQSESDANNKILCDNGKKDSSCDTQAQRKGFKTLYGTFDAELKWLNIISITAIHATLCWGLVVYPYTEKYWLVLYGFLIGGLNGLGVTGGAHRLWCHRSYKAKLPLRIILMLCFSLAAQNTLYDWVRDHRVHHRYTETDADPHNSKRGFFFAHVGWLMMRKHPEVLRRGKEVDMSDIMADPVVQFHQKHFILLKLLFGFIIPTIIPPLTWGQDWYWSILLVCVGRYTFALNFTWLVNSAAHLWGKRPYDKKISPAENLTVSILAMGEGWHNYHHTFPWDYKTAELGKYSVNLTTFWIDVFAKIGWAYDLKQPSTELVKRVAEKHGDGSHQIWGHVEIPENGDLGLLDSDKSTLTKSD